MRTDWQWLMAAGLIALLCLLAVWMPFWIAGLGS